MKSYRLHFILPLMFVFLAGTGCSLTENMFCKSIKEISEMHRDKGKELADKNAELNKNLKDYKHENDRLKKKNKDLEAEVLQLTENNTALTKHLALRNDAYGNLEKERNSIKAALKELRESIAGLISKAPKDDRVKKLEEEIRKLQGKGVVVTVDKGRVKVSISSDFLFDLGSYAVKAGGKESLKKIIETVNGPKWKGKIDSIQVIGHTDNVPVRNPSKYFATTTQNANMVLGFLRAFYVSIEMVKMETPWEMIDVASRGPFHPLRPNDSAANRRMNRRVDVFIKPKPAPAHKKVGEYEIEEITEERTVDEPTDLLD